KHELEAHPDDYRGHAVLGQCYLWKKDLPMAIPEFRRAVEIENAPFTLAWLGYAYAVSGQRAQALHVLDQMQTRSKSVFVQPYYYAIVYAGLGDQDHLFDQLESGVS